MNKYSDKSDFEINKAVAEYINIKIGYEFINFDEDGIFIQNYDNINSSYSDGEPERIEFDPCNNPSDAMPIINEYGISLIYQEGEFQFATNDGNYHSGISNPLKAAMIIFLMMKEKGNENV